MGKALTAVEHKMDIKSLAAAIWRLVKKNSDPEWDQVSILKMMKIEACAARMLRNMSYKDALKAVDDLKLLKDELVNF